MFMYFEKATQFCEISTVDLTGTTQDKSTVEISQNFVAISKYMNFTKVSKGSFFQKVLMHLSFPQTHEPFILLNLKILIFVIFKASLTTLARSSCP